MKQAPLPPNMQREVANLFVSDKTLTLADVGRRYSLTCARVSYFVKKFFPYEKTNRSWSETSRERNLPELTERYDPRQSSSFIQEWAKRPKREAPKPNAVPWATKEKLMAGR